MEEESSLGEILESTLAVSRGLEALQKEHGALLEQLAGDTTQEEEAGTAIELQEHKKYTLNKSTEKLKAGINEAKLMLMLATYVNTLEADRNKLRQQVKRLCSENNWLRSELTDHQQLLQDTEVQLAKTKEEKEHLQFLLSLKESGDRRTEREQSPSMDIDVQEEEAEGVHVQGSRSGMVDASNSGTSVQEGQVEYDVPDNIKTLHSLALQYVNQGRPHVAVPLCKKAVQELEQKKGRNNPDVASMLNILAVIYREQGKLKDATKVLHDTLDIREKVFGPNHPAVASTYNNLSVLHGKCGEFKVAEPYCRKALEIRQKLLGASHPDVAKQFTNLAILCSHLGKYDDVEHYYMRALEIYQTELGPDDPNVSKTLHHLANCYLKQGNYKAAENTFKKVLDTVHASGSNEEPRSSEQAAWVLNTPESPRRGKEEAYHGWGVPVQSPTVSSTLRSLSTVYREQGRVETADELEKLTGEEVLDRAQQDRVAELLSHPDSSPELPVSPAAKNQQVQAARQRQGSRAYLPQSVRKLFRIRGEEGSQDGNS